MIKVVCTGKGTHRELSLGKRFDFGALSPASTRDVPYPQSYDAWRDLDLNKQSLADGYTFTCRRCAPVRNTEMKKKTIRLVLDGLQAAGRQTLDISLLPF